MRLYGCSAGWRATTRGCVAADMAQTNSAPGSCGTTEHQSSARVQKTVVHQGLDVLRSLLGFLILLGLCLNAVKAAPVFPQARYTIEVPSGLGILRVRACFEAGGAFNLEPASPKAGRLLAGVESSGGASVAVQSDRIMVSNAADDTCLIYRVDLTAATRRGHWRDGFVVATGAILIDPDLFLWLPEGTTDVGVDFRLPPGYSVSAPWESLAMTDRGAVFRTGVLAGRGDGKVALGRIEKLVMTQGLFK